MIKKTLNLFNISPQFIGYAIIGVSGVFLDYLTYVTLVKFFEMNYQVANVISTSVGITNNFIMNALFNFKVKDRLLARYFQFYAVGLLGLVVTAVILYAAIALLGMGELIPKFLSLFVVVILQYTLNKRVSFKASVKS